MNTEYTYPGMTPDIEKYLHLQKLHPGYKYAGSSIPTPESNAAVEAWKRDVETSKAALPEGEPAAYYHAHKVWLCRDETASGEPQEEVSPSGKYRLVVTQHTTGKGTWNCSKGRVYAGDTLITDVCRNYGAFPFAWIEGHGKTGHDYLVCGEDYQGQTVVNLVTGLRVDHLPKEASEGVGFCWASIHPNADGTLLAVCGCYWACPYETIIVDFSTPMEPPWTILARDSEDAFDGWTGLDSCKIGTRHEVVDIPWHHLHGKTENDCTIEDLEEIERYCAEHPEIESKDGCDQGWREVLETHEWRKEG